MKNIQDLYVTQIRIFPEGVIPYHVLSLPTKIKELKERYNFAGEEIPVPLQLPGSPRIIVFQMGEAKIEGSSTIIAKLQFEARKIILEVAASSIIATKVFLDIATFINELAGSSSLSDDKVLTKTEETKCNVTLDIDYWAVFSDKMKRFVNSELKKSFEQPVLSINPNKLSFEIAFVQDIDLFSKQRIHFVPKPFTIEPREGIPFEENTFFTCSPFGSDLHFRLVEDFEKLFQAKKKKK